jgi:16S rRNA (guanine966-N2)-methyltransferase
VDQVRVVAGAARGRRLQVPPGTGTRPTLDRVREALFNTLVSLDAVEGAVVVDLFAGSGALGIEALSRGAASCTFVDRDRAARRTIEANLAATGLASRARVAGGDALRWLAEAAGPVDLALLDPPYATDDATWNRLLAAVAAVAPGGIVVVESDRAITLGDGWSVLRQKRYGDTLLVIAQPLEAPPPMPSPEPS